MIDEDRPRLHDAMLRLCQASRVEFDDDLVDGYMMALSDLPISAVETFLLSFVDVGRRLPSTWEVRDQIAGGCGNDAVIRAWLDVLRQVESVGSKGRPEFAPHVREAVVSCGGWSRLCESPEDFKHQFYARAKR